MSHFKSRTDAVWHDTRRIVPTTAETKWITTWQQFRDAGGITHFNEDQTELVLTLPEGCKFGIGFSRAHA